MSRAEAGSREGRCWVPGVVLVVTVTIPLALWVRTPAVGTIPLALLLYGPGIALALAFRRTKVAAWTAAAIGAAWATGALLTWHWHESYPYPESPDGFEYLGIAVGWWVGIGALAFGYSVDRTGNPFAPRPAVR